MSEFHYNCQTCNAPSVARRKDAKHCNPCRALKVLEFLRSRYKRVRVCRTCKAKFRPQGQKDLAYCGQCEVRQLGDGPYQEHPCALCSRPVHIASTLKTVCLVCIKDPAIQDKVVALLHRQQAERQLAHKE